LGHRDGGAIPPSLMGVRVIKNSMGNIPARQLNAQHARSTEHVAPGDLLLQSVMRRGFGRGRALDREDAMRENRVKAKMRQGTLALGTSVGLAIPPS